MGVPKPPPLAIHLDGRPWTVKAAAEFLAREIQGDVMAGEAEIANAIEACIWVHRQNADARATARAARAAKRKAR